MGVFLHLSNENNMLELEKLERIYLSNRIAFIVSCVAFPYIFIFRFYSVTLSNVVIFIIAIFLSVICLNKFKFHNVSRYLLILSTNATAAYYAASFGKVSGIQYLFFAYLALPMVIFSFHESRKIIWGTLIPLICILYLELSHFYSPTPVLTSPSFQNLIHLTSIFFVSIIIILSLKSLFFSLSRLYAGLLQSNDKLSDSLKEMQEMYQELKEKKRMDAELLAAAEIQRSALPQSPPKIKGFVVEDWFVPARGVSGDYFDYVDISASQTGFLIADITGKGIPAALMMMNLRSLWQSFDASVGTPAEILTQLNTLLYYHPTIQKQVPMIYGVLDVEKRVFTYCNAGHEPGLHVHENNAEELKVSGPALGVEATIVLEDYEIVLSQNDRLLLFTDGVTDIKNPTKNKFGHVALMDMIFTLTVSLPATDFLETFKENLMAYMQHEPQADDITLLSISANRR